MWCVGRTEHGTLDARDLECADEHHANETNPDPHVANVTQSEQHIVTRHWHAWPRQRAHTHTHRELSAARAGDQSVFLSLRACVLTHESHELESDECLEQSQSNGDPLLDAQRHSILQQLACTQHGQQHEQHALHEAARQCNTPTQAQVKTHAV